MAFWWNFFLFEVILIFFCVFLIQDSDGEKSDLDLVVDDANQVSCVERFHS